jgi:CheY-like chemotaxis protein
MSDTHPTISTDDFSRWVSDAIGQLYDSVALQSHPLGKALYPTEAHPIRRCQALRKALLDAIHSLEPGPGVPGSAPDRRLYRLVELRFIEGLDPVEAMNRLGLAKSQFYRDQSRALEILVETLWTLLPAPQKLQDINDPRTRLIHAEVDRLSPRRESEGIDADALAADLKQIIAPLAEDRQVSIDDFNLAKLQSKTLDRVLLRQALLTALTAALDIPGMFSLKMQCRQSLDDLSILVTAATRSNFSTSIPFPSDQLEACRLLIDALGGKLETSLGPQSVTFILSWSEYRKKLLLVIDDNTGMADLFRLYLKGSGWQVAGAAGGQEARQVLRENRPDLIMLDILMPQEDGWELLRVLKTDDGSQEIPVIICSVLKQPQIALKLGASAYVEKPVSQQDLLEVVTRFGKVAVS